MDDDCRPIPGNPLPKGGVRAHPHVEIEQLVKVLRRAGVGGCVEVSSHFKMRAAQRGFTTPEALAVLRHGVIKGQPEFCPEFCNWKFSVELEHDDGILIIVASVSAGDLGQPWSSNVLLITGFVQ